MVKIVLMSFLITLRPQLRMSKKPNNMHLSMLYFKIATKKKKEEKNVVPELLLVKHMHDIKTARNLVRVFQISSEQRRQVVPPHYVVVELG